MVKELKVEAHGHWIFLFFIDLKSAFEVEKEKLLPSAIYNEL